VTIKDEILTELRNLTPLAEIRRKYRSQSQTYEAIRKFLEETDKTVKESQEKLETVNQETLAGQAELQTLKMEREMTSEETTKLQLEKETLVVEVANKRGELARLNAGMEELKEKGFTSEIMNKIKAIENRSGPELLLQVETVEKHRQVEEEVTCLTEKKADLEGDVQALQIKRRKIEESTISEKNKLDELKLQTATFREAVAIVSSFFRDGYSTKDLISLKKGVDILGIKGNQTLSLKRLMDGLSKQTSLTNLGDTLGEKKKELTTLNKAIADAKIELQIAKDATLKTFKEVRNTALEAIANTAEQANKTTKDMTTIFETQVTQSIGKIDAHVRQTMEAVKTGLGDYGDLQQQKAKMEEFLLPSRAFLGLLQSTEYLSKIPLPLTIRLLERLHLWTEIHLKDFRIKPSENIQKKEYNLKTWDSYNIQVLIEFLIESLTERMIQQGRQN